MDGAGAPSGRQVAASEQKIIPDAVSTAATSTSDTIGRAVTSAAGTAGTWLNGDTSRTACGRPNRSPNSPHPRLTAPAMRSIAVWSPSRWAGVSSALARMSTSPRLSRIVPASLCTSAPSARDTSVGMR